MLRCFLVVGWLARDVPAVSMRRIPLSAIRDAAASIYNVARRIPLVPLELPPAVRSRLGGCAVYLKLEVFQPIGAFKIRGAWNAVRQIPPDELRDGVWTVSAGNAAQGVALAARTAGVPCRVMVMDTAPKAKLQAIERLGASTVSATYDECWRTVEDHGSDRMRGRLIHPFDDDHVIAGNGTLGLEIVEDLPDVDAIVAPLGGGGLLAGVASALRELRPETQVFAAEPETAAPFAASLRNGRASVFEGWQSSFVAGAGGKSVLPTMWPLLSTLLAGSIVVSLDEVAAAMRLVAERCHVIAEGAAGCAVAAALNGRLDPGSTAGPVRKKIVAVVSGGNIDLSKFASLVGACP
ncbi:MAG: threonine/serine dehydratase [Acidobacteria bacterium]|nr:threonine/serine dehydratase [Acidobacteriota bacterium]